jgi:hypothetical protein
MKPRKIVRKRKVVPKQPDRTPDQIYVDSLDVQLDHLIKDLIYHGRYFSATRDTVVIKKSLDFFKKLLEEQRARQNKGA